jgi:hypothetical protein
MIMTFSTSGPPQYVVVCLVFCEVKDIIGYLNINKFGCFRFLLISMVIAFGGTENVVIAQDSKDLDGLIESGLPIITGSDKQ